MKLTTTDKMILNDCLGIWYAQLGNPMEAIWGIDEDLCNGNKLNVDNYDFAYELAIKVADFVLKDLIDCGITEPLFSEMAQFLIDLNDFIMRLEPRIMTKVKVTK